MRSFTDFFSKTTESLSFLFYCTSATLILFRPTLQEFVVLFVVDSLALVLCGFLDKKIYPKLYPQVRPFFLQFDEEIKNYSTDQKIGLFETLLDFPRKRSFYFIFANIVKVLPAGMVILFYFHSTNFTLHLIKYLVLQTSIIVSHYVITYMELHDLVSRKIAELHQRFDWADVFDSLGPVKTDRSFIKQVTVAMSIFAFLLLLSFLLLVEEGKFNWWFLVLGVSGYLNIAWAYHLERRIFVGGMEKIFSSLNGPQKVAHDAWRSRPVLPFHSVAFLANFEHTFNQLTKRLQLHEQEISLWVLKQSEKSRLEVLGEISGLVVHDLTGPLHSIQFCVSEIKEAQAIAPEFKSYLEQLELNTQRVSELVNSLRSSLREPDRAQERGHFVSSHEYCRNLLSGQFSKLFFQRIRFQIDPRLKHIRPKISQVNLIHILYNLYKNSIQSLLDSNTAVPEIQLKVSEFGTDTIHLIQSDNGKGMSEEDFEQLTSYRYLNRK